MVRTLKPSELERLLRAQRNMKIALAVTVAALVGALVLLIAADVTLPVVPGVGLGMGIGALLTLPYQRLLRQLGLTRQEASAILAAERERRTGRADLSAEARARRHLRTSRICLIGGLALVPVFLVSASHFFDKANQPVIEGAPFDVWFAVSFFAGFASLIAAPILLWLSRHHKRGADQPGGGRHGQ